MKSTVICESLLNDQSEVSKSKKKNKKKKKSKKNRSISTGSKKCVINGIMEDGDCSKTKESFLKINGTTDSAVIEEDDGRSLIRRSECTTSNKLDENDREDITNNIPATGVNISSKKPKTVSVLKIKLCHLGVDSKMHLNNKSRKQENVSSNKCVTDSKPECSASPKIGKITAKDSSNELLGEKEVTKSEKNSDEKGVKVLETIIDLDNEPLPVESQSNDNESENKLVKKYCSFIVEKTKMDVDENKENRKEEAEACKDEGGKSVSSSVNCDASSEERPIGSDSEGDLILIEDEFPNSNKKTNETLALSESKTVIDSAETDQTSLKMNNDVKINEGNNSEKSSENTGNCINEVKSSESIRSRKRSLKRDCSADLVKKRKELSEPKIKENSSFKNSSVGDRSSGTEIPENRKKPATRSSFLSSFRGKLKNLTRSDLEELIVQKLCEVITERSATGELRRKAQALEMEIERWKNKVQFLTKQTKEMEMVMKKYMNEVQKQVQEGDRSHVVVPIKVTRSVGLQVTFLPGGNKSQKPPQTQIGQSSTTNSVTTNVSPVVKNSKVVPSNPPPQLNTSPQNARNKPVLSIPKPGGTVQKFPLPKKPGNQRMDSVGNSPHPQLNRLSQNQAQRSIRPVHSAVANLQHHVGHPSNQHHLQTQSMQFNTHTSQQQLSSPSHLKNQQSSSKVIDLTEDDDRQSDVTIKSSSNHATVVSPGSHAKYLSQSQVPPNVRHNIGSKSYSSVSTTNLIVQNRQLLHPAPLPQAPGIQYNKSNFKLIPPRPALKISRTNSGIVLSWNMALGPEHEPISSYQLYAYQETNSPPATTLWKKVGEVDALPLPMACTLTQFMSGHKYHFAVRAVDFHSRFGPFSAPCTIVLLK